MGYRREVTIGANPGAVWAAWASQEQTQAWLAPRARVEFVAGGAYEFFWDADPARDSTLGCRLLTLEPERRLVFEWQGKTEYLPMFQAPHGPVTVEVEFVPTPAGTTVVVTQHETRPLPQWAEYDEWMAGAWDHALAALKAHSEGAGAGPT